MSFVGSSMGFCWDSVGFLLSSRWVPVGFTLGSSSFWVCFGVFVSSRSRTCEFWGPFWGYLWVFWVFRGFRGVPLVLRWVSVGILLGFC